MTLLRATSFANELKAEVPAEFWQADELEDGTRVGVIACPCGEQPIVADNGTALCDGEEDGKPCGRIFLMLGDRVWVARYDSKDLTETPAG